MKIAVAGTGYVGLSIATLLSQHHEVMAVDIVEEKVNLSFKTVLNALSQGMSLFYQYNIHLFNRLKTF